MDNLSEIEQARLSIAIAHYALKNIQQSQETEKQSITTIFMVFRDFLRQGLTVPTLVLNIPEIQPNTQEFTNYKHNI